MAWTVLYHDAFLPEMEVLAESVQDELLALVELLTMSDRGWVGLMPIPSTDRSTPT